MSNIAEKIKKQLPKEFEPLVDLYGPIIVNMTFDSLAAFIKASQQGNRTKAKKLIRAAMTHEELSLDIKVTRQVLRAIRAHSKESREAWDQFLDALMAIGMLYLKSKIGVYSESIR